MWEKDNNIHEVKEIRTRTSVFFGVCAIKKIDDIARDLKSKGIDKDILILLVIAIISIVILQMIQNINRKKLKISV